MLAVRGTSNCPAGRPRSWQPRGSTATLFACLSLGLAGCAIGQSAPTRAQLATALEQRWSTMQTAEPGGANQIDPACISSSCYVATQDAYARAVDRFNRQLLAIRFPADVNTNVATLVQADNRLSALQRSCTLSSITTIRQTQISSFQGAAPQLEADQLTAYEILSRTLRNQ
jgi:hypothetical protein